MLIYLGIGLIAFALAAVIFVLISLYMASNDDSTKPTYDVGIDDS